MASGVLAHPKSLDYIYAGANLLRVNRLGGSASSPGVTSGGGAVATEPVAAATEEGPGLVAWILPVGLLFTLALAAWLWGRRRGTTP